MTVTVVQTTPGQTLFGSGGTFTRTGGTSDGQALSDESDTTYVKRTSTAKSYATLAVDPPSLPAGECFWRCRGYARVLSPASSSFRIGVDNDVIGGGATYTVFNGAYTVGTQYGAWAYSSEKYDPDLSEPWADDDPIDSLKVYLADVSAALANAATFYEAGVEYETTSLPTTTITQPTGSTSTNKPTFILSGSDTDGWSLYRHETVVYPSTVYSKAGFDPANPADATDPATYLPFYYQAVDWGNGDSSNPDRDTYVRQDNANTSFVIGPALTVGTTYRVYSRTSKLVNGVPKYGAWQVSTFTIAATQPNAPTLSASWDSANNRMTLTLTDRANLLNRNAASGGEVTAINTTTDVVAVTNAAAATRSTAQKNSGTYSVLLASSAAGTMVYRTGTRPIASNGKVVSGTVKLRAATAGRTCRVGLRYYDGAGTQVGTDQWGTGAANNTTGFTTYTIQNNNPPANTASVSLLIEVQSTAAGAEQHYADELGIVMGTTAGTWDQGGWLSRFMTIERSLDGGTTWSTITAQPGQYDHLTGLAPVWTLYDYTVPRGTAGVSASYRAKLTATDEGLAVSVESAVSSTASASSTQDGKWWLKAPEQPTLNIGSVRVQADPGFSMDAGVAVVNPLGRDTKVVITGDVYGEDGQFDVVTRTAAEWDALRAILRYTGTLLVQDPFGEEKFVRVTSRSWALSGTVSQPVRRVSVGYVQVEPVDG